MPRSDTRGKQNKARVAEAVRGTYPIWNRYRPKGILCRSSSSEDGEIVLISK